jgi:hypothetical protein
MSLFSPISSLCRTAPLRCFAATSTSLQSSWTSIFSSHKQQQSDNQHFIQRRSYYKIQLTKRFDPVSGAYKYQEWSRLARFLPRPQASSGLTLVRRDWIRSQHLKPTTRRRLINERKVYRRMVKQIQDLTSYIKFKQDYDKKE